MRRFARGAIGCGVLLVACGGAVTGAMGATDGKEDGGGVGGSGGSGNVVSGGRANVGAGGIGNGSGGRMQSGAGGIGRAGAAGSFDAGAGGTVMKPPKSCVFGTSTPCACDFGLTGARLCLVTGVFGDCSCPVRVPTCQDGVRNGNETDVDCGGTCRVCAVGLACSMNTDCASSMCVAGVCAVPDSSTGPGTQDAGSSSPEAAPAPSCLDGVRNGFETDVDCGGVDCPNCGPGRSCQVPADCVTSVCFPSHVCGTAECTDGMQNGLETDVDCGGSCAPCGVGRACLVGLDCTSSVCVAQTCLPPTCSDAVKNGTESDVDCGGACPACPAGRACLVDADCVQNQCTANVCASP